jgi:hypothetical protein
MKKFNLSVGERLQSFAILNSEKIPDLKTLKAAMADIDAIQLSDEERTEVNIRTENNSIMWDKDKEVLKDVTLSDETVAFLKKFIEAKTDFTLGDRYLVSLEEKLS